MCPRSSWVDGPQRQEILSVGGGRLPPLMSQLLYWGHLDDDGMMVVMIMVVMVLMML
jgi:hypothetical protein